MDEVRKGLVLSDADDRDSLAVAPLEVRVAGDVDLDELEWNVAPNALDDAARALAEVTPLRGVERYAGCRRYG